MADLILKDGKVTYIDDNGNSLYSLPATAGSEDQVITLDANGNFTYDTIGAISLSNADTDDLTEGSTNLYYTDAKVQAVSINNVVEDTTPQLGGNLDAQSYNITTSGTITAGSFSGDGSGLTGVSAVTELSNDTSPVLSADLDVDGNNILMGTNTITDTKVGQWDTAYGWGDHSSAGYINSETYSTASELLTAIKTVDGASSGLDADTLDGQQGSYYLNYNNLTNTPSISSGLDSDATIALIDSDYVQARQASAGISEVVSDTTPELGGDLASNGNDINFANLDKAQFGNTQQLQIFTNNSQSYVKSADNILVLSTNNKVQINNTGGFTGFECDIDAATWLSYNRNKKLETTNTGVDITGTITVEGFTETQVTKSASFTPSFTEGTIFKCSGTMTITMPTATAGKSFTIIHTTGTSITWSGSSLKWSDGSAPTAGSGIDIYTFISDGTNWYGMQAGTNFA